MLCPDNPATCTNPVDINNLPSGSITFRTYFNPVTVGCFVAHCHTLDHEDLGMMQRMDILPAPGQPSGCNLDQASAVPLIEKFRLTIDPAAGAMPPRSLCSISGRRSTLAAIRIIRASNGPFLSHKGTEQERRCAGIMEFRRKRRLSLRTALTENRCFPIASATLYKSPKLATYCFH